MSVRVLSRFTISRTSELRLALSTGLAAFMNFASSDAADSGRFASPSGTSTVSLSNTSVAAGHGASDDLPRSGAAGIDARSGSSALTGRSCRGSVRLFQIVSDCFRLFQIVSDCFRLFQIVSIPKKGMSSCSQM
jgi:hypothetical protein